MNVREALLTDIPQMNEVRLAVKENALTGSGEVTQQDYADHLSAGGKGWVCEMDNRVVGFAIGDLNRHNLWALFVLPEYEEQGVGRELLITLLDWYYSQTRETIWLSTAPDTRAAEFYRSFGFAETGKMPNGEIRFELSADDWGA
ncbi:GNAT family N-acetyltransferase [Longitalea luteola]|uniref:GNAT family N-acetyltransferase n=1 Tax=Longitalea luteola TaxID=2812563 RepID=UPI001A95DE22|nr:GNAT family N-acetyltransferase [Longitalea luteola]